MGMEGDLAKKIAEARKRAEVIALSSSHSRERAAGLRGSGSIRTHKIGTRPIGISQFQWDKMSEEDRMQEEQRILAQEREGAEESDEEAERTERGTAEVYDYDQEHGQGAFLRRESLRTIKERMEARLEQFLRSLHRDITNDPEYSGIEITEQDIAEEIDWTISELQRRREELLQWKRKEDERDKRRKEGSKEAA